MNRLLLVLLCALVVNEGLAQTSQTTKPANCNDIRLLTITPGSLLGSKPSTGTVTLKQPAKQGGLTVQLESEDASAASVPAQIVVPAGATTSDFPIQTSPVSTDTHVFIRVLCGNDQRYAPSAQISVRPPRLETIELPKAIRPGASATGRLALNGPAPPSGVAVAMDPSSYLIVAPIVEVPGGQIGTTFEIRADPQSGEQSQSISGRAGGSVISSGTRISKTAPIAVMPPQSIPQQVVSVPSLPQGPGVLTPATGPIAGALATAGATPVEVAPVLTPKAITATNPPLTAVSRIVGEVELSWPSISGVQSYVIQGPGFAVPLRTQLTTTTVQGVPPGTHTYVLFADYGPSVPPDETNLSKATVTVEAADAAARRAFAEAKPKFGIGDEPDQGLWEQTAVVTGYSYEELVRHFRSIWLVAYAYKHLLGRTPDSEGAKYYLKQLSEGMPWGSMWLEIAHSDEREKKFGFWAPAPVDSVDEAARVFGNSVVHAETCFGGLGDQCDTNLVGQPHWTGHFKLPDGTIMGYITVNVAVGSILHDNACVASKGTGLYCRESDFVGFVAIDLMSTIHPSAMAYKLATPATFEWNKAVYNFVQFRYWRETFGPYPEIAATRRLNWYDDVRPVAPRKAFMAPVVGVVTLPANMIRFDGTETRRSKQLSAPAGTWLDIGDEDFCSSKAFSVILPLWGLCK